MQKLIFRKNIEIREDFVIPYDGRIQWFYVTEVRECVILCKNKKDGTTHEFLYSVDCDAEPIL